MTEHSNFKDAYGVLTRHAKTLREQHEPNIDDLLKVVTESVDAYKVCKARIDAVEKALEQALSTAEEGTVGQASQTKASTRSQPARPTTASWDQDDEEIPF
jgi:exodeoxyribonuclease VII small subunit